MGAIGTAARGWRALRSLTGLGTSFFFSPVTDHRISKRRSHGVNPTVGAAQGPRPALGDVWQRKLAVSWPLQRAGAGARPGRSSGPASPLHTFCLILDAGWWSPGSSATNQTHSGLISFHLAPEGEKPNCCLSCESLLRRKGAIILIRLLVWAARLHALPSRTLPLPLPPFFLFLRI